MTPTEKLIKKLNAYLANHGMQVSYIEYVTGHWKHADVLRWEGMVRVTNIPNANNIWTIGSWDTIKNCLRGFEVKFDRRKSEVDILVSATEGKPQ